MSLGSLPISDSSSRPHVLVADDDPAVRRLIVRALIAAGFEVSEAPDGRTAAQLVAQTAFAAVVTDVTMPGVRGTDLLRLVREHDLDLPVILITGDPNLDSAIEALRLGATDYFTKPVELSKLQRKLHRVVQLRQLARARREVHDLLRTGRPEAGDLAGLAVTFDRALRSLWLAYQPIVDVASHAPFGYEALLRSREPTLPHPGAVLEAAERLGRLDDIGRAVRDMAPAPMVHAPAPALLFVNLHARDLADEALFDPASPLGSIAPQVVLEITERASLDEVRDLKGRVARLRQLGYRVAVDDLGAGYAGLTSFAQLEPDIVKLDMTLVRDVDKDAVKQKVIRSVTRLCGEMGISVVAEGIETPEERTSVIDLGCSLLQGYLLSRPGAPFPEVAW